LLTRLTTEVAETARYRRLRSLVNYADPFVQKAAVQLGQLAFIGEKSDLQPLSDQFQEQLNSFDATGVGGLARVEKAYADLAKADAKASFRIYSDIGLTHRAIQKSLNDAASIEELTEANKRIFALAEAVKAVVDD
ncbi:MAG: hypothetical protein AAF678_12360, partial [Pseudomonadota bacterium]